MREGKQRGNGRGSRIDLCDPGNFTGQNIMPYLVKRFIQNNKVQKQYTRERICVQLTVQYLKLDDINNAFRIILYRVLIVL